MAQDEWRVEVDLDDPEHGFPLGERLHALDLDDEVAERLGKRVIVTRDGPHLFVYTESPEAALEAERVVRDVVETEGLSAEVSRSRWNPLARDWQDADRPLDRVSAGDAGDAGGDEAEDEEGIQHPLFVFIERHEPRFMRDLGI